MGKRLLAGFATLIVASVLVFVGTSVIPGSPAESVLGRNAEPAQVAQIDKRLGYDKPVVTRYLQWLDGLLHGELGDSAIAVAQGASSAPIWPAIRRQLANSTILALTTTALLIPLSLLLGVAAGVQAGRWPDALISTITLIGTSLPEFVLGALMIALFFVVLNVLPPVSLVAPGSTPLAHPSVLVLPVLTLLGVSLASTIRLVRLGTIEVLRQDYVRLARLNGIPRRTVLRRYVLRNALAPSVQIFALSIQYLFGGVIVTEAIFSYPGIGKQLVDAVTSHDNTMVQAIALILTSIYILINIMADLVVVLLIPKLRTAQ